MLPTVMGAFALLVMVTVCAVDETPTLVLGNVNVVGDRVGSTGATPVPESVALKTGLASVVVMLSAPVRVPAAVGVKTTFTVHEEPAVSMFGLTGQVLLTV